MQAALDETIGAIYDAVLEPGGWPAALGRIVEVTGSGSGNLVSSDRAYSHASVAVYHGIDPDWIERYNDHYCRFDPSMAIFARNRGRVVVDQVTGPDPRQLSGHSRYFYHELMLPQSFHYTAGAALFATGTHQAAFILQRDRRQGPYSERDLGLLERLTPHVRRALQLTRHQHEIGFQRGIAAAYENSHLGVILLDEVGRVHYLNRRAEELVRRFPALEIRDDRLQLDDPASRADFERRLRSVLSPASAVGGSPARPMRVDSQGQSMELQLSPVSGFAADRLLGIPGRKVMVQLGDPRPMRSLRASMLASHFNLSRAEAGVLAGLCIGQDTSEIAAARSRSVHTVRSQVKSIMRKLGVQRRTELVRLVLSSAVVRSDVE